jgi:hypothetical protein
MLALVFAFFCAFKQGVFAFVRAGRVTWTGGVGQTGDARGFESAVFAIVVHGLTLFTYPSRQGGSGNTSFVSMYFSELG